LEYAAPEVLEGGAPTPLSDLYSLGVSLHELLSGANPFARVSPPEVIRAHFEPAPPANAGAAVQAVVAKLLARDPRARYADADEVIEALAAARETELEREGEGLSPDRIGLGSIFGVEAELSRFGALLGPARAGSGAAVTLAGPRGSGRSRLLRQARIAAELGGLRALQLCGSDGMATLCSWLGTLLGERSPFLPGVALALDRLARLCARQPLALFIDDADREEGRQALVAALQGEARPPGLLLVSVGEATPQAWVLLPLTRELAESKLLEIFGPTPWAAPLAALLAKETSRTPAALEGAVQELAARGVLLRRHGRWVLEVARAGEGLIGCLPRAALDEARDRLAERGPVLREALGRAAVLGPAVGRAALEAVVSPALVAALVASGLLLEEGPGLRFPRLALWLAAERALPEAVRRAAHLAAAAATPEPLARAQHLFRAHGRGRVRAALAAARAQLRAGHPDRAARLYDLARVGLGATVRSARAAHLCERAGDCRALAGEPGGARRAYTQALARGGSAPRLLEKLAKAGWQEGRFDEVLAEVARARSAGADPLALAILEARTEAMRGDYRRADRLATEALRLARAPADGAAASRLHHLLGTCAWHRGDGPRAIAEERTAVLIARRAGDRRAEADARAGLGSAYRLLSKYDRSARETARAIELYLALGDERQEALSWNNLGVTRYLAGDWAGALQAWEKLAARPQTLEQELLTLNNLGFLYRERGDLPRARELLQRAREKLSAAGGFARLEATVRGNLGEIAARAGDLATAAVLYRETAELALRLGARDEQLETERRLVELELLQRAPAAAEGRAAAALLLARETGNQVEEGNLLRLQALAARARGDGPAADAAVRAALAVLERAGAALELARAECTAALLAIDRSDPAAASLALGRARGVFEKLGAAPDLVEVERLESAAHALQHRSLSRIEALTQAAQRLAAPSDPSALLEDVLDQALQLTGAERGFILLREKDGEPTVAAVRGADSDATLRISRTVADRVLHTGEVMAVADIVGRDQLSTQRSILDLGLRSVLCAPIRSGGRQLGILYVDSRRVGAPLSEKDLALMSAFAALAGSALENARLIADLQRKSDLLSHMAHEFRSPLVGIKGYAELLHDTKGLSQQASEDLDVIVEQATRLSKLVGRTLDLARVEAGAVKLARLPVDLLEVATSAAAGLLPIAQMKSIAVSVSQGDGVPSALGDFDRLVQVITNLVGNAIHYSGSGTKVSVEIVRGAVLPPAAPAPRIAIEGAQEEAVPAPVARTSVEVRVTDQGPGMSPENVAKLFTPFFRAGTPKAEGTGLGLVISREIVRQHNGQIRVASELGRGTTFTVVLPGAA
jgi:signal transduction histidine kinase/tetratricopeptide (TPR) repeat protein